MPLTWKLGNSESGSAATWEIVLLVGWVGMVAGTPPVLKFIVTAAGCECGVVVGDSEVSEDVQLVIESQSWSECSLASSRNGLITQTSMPLAHFSNVRVHSVAISLDELLSDHGLISASSCRNPMPHSQLTHLLYPRTSCFFIT